jgi:hypothetical protein
MDESVEDDAQWLIFVSINVHRLLTTTTAR